ncbi:hypothetical protein [Actinomadura hibisca]|uniref:hypothetical protein n=1 Tax=Actinomadura hibisca TaxID=68565 RepID=UPI00082CCF46|nr:hypothetical protein [Actinomadura hibisca]
MTRPGPDSGAPGADAAVQRPAVREVAVQMGRNRPSLGSLAVQLAVPGTAHAVLGWPVWAVAAPLWGLCLLLVLFVSVAELRQPPHNASADDLGRPLVTQPEEES